MTRRPLGLSVPYRKVNKAATEESSVARKWRGLTDAEIDECIGMDSFDIYKAIKKAEAKLKEKNHDRARV